MFCPQSHSTAGTRPIIQLNLNIQWDSHTRPSLLQRSSPGKISADAPDRCPVPCHGAPVQPRYAQSNRTITDALSRKPSHSPSRRTGRHSVMASRSAIASQTVTPRHPTPMHRSPAHARTRLKTPPGASRTGLPRSGVSTSQPPPHARWRRQSDTHPHAATAAGITIMLHRPPPSHPVKGPSQTVCTAWPRCAHQSKKRPTALGRTIPRSCGQRCESRLGNREKALPRQTLGELAQKTGKRWLRLSHLPFRRVIDLAQAATMANGV